MRALAARHPYLADLALSFPTLLLALAVPRRGLDPGCAIEHTIDGAPLPSVAAAAEVPLWLRRLPPQALSQPIPRLPDSKTFRRQVANHLPFQKDASAWLQTVSDMADIADEAVALWVVREMAREMRSTKLHRRHLVGLWAWFSNQPDTFGHSLIGKRWTPAVRLSAALDAAEDWRTTFNLYLVLGREPVTELWLRPARVDGYDFQSLASVEEIAEEAAAMRNCLRTYGGGVAHNRLRLWSMRRDGRRVATLQVSFYHGQPLPDLAELKGPGNTSAPVEVWRAARRWLVMHDQSPAEPRQCTPNSVPLDHATWQELWRPYWLAKRRLPRWLPLSPSRKALSAL